MWGIQRLIEEEKPFFLPDRLQLSYFTITVDGSIVKYHNVSLCKQSENASKKPITLFAVILSVAVKPS
jgi:hypothetical protein